LTLKPLPLLALLLATACAQQGPPLADTPPENPLQATCRAEARRDPEVINFGRQLNMGNWSNEQRVGHDIRVAELRAFRDCMRRNGAAMPGGVESVRAPG
jgi:hypothetical protein